MTRADFVNVIALDLEICARQIGLIATWAAQSFDARF
jgi:hypothetical protein